MQDSAQFVQLAQTLCYDLARAEKATDGKKKRRQGTKRATRASPVPCLPWKVHVHATQNDGGCRQAPCLPRKVTLDAAKCQAATPRQLRGATRGSPVLRCMQQSPQHATVCFCVFVLKSALEKSSSEDHSCVPCGRLVVISGILAGGTLGFRNVMFCFCTFPGPLTNVMFLVCLLVLRKAQSLQHISCFEFE